MENLNQIYNNISFFNKIKEVEKSDLVFSISGMTIGEKVLLLRVLNKQSIFIAKDLIELSKIREGLSALNIKCSTLLADLSAPLVTKLSNQKTENIKNLYDFATGKTKILLLTSENLLIKYNQKISTKNILSLSKGQCIDIDNFTKNLVNIGYTKNDKVESVGDFSVKGDIVDVYCLNEEYPIRFDFFDDILDNIYTFNLDEMHKLLDLKTVNIYPNKLNFLPKEYIYEIQRKLNNSLLNLNLQGDAVLKCHSNVKTICEKLQEEMLDLDNDFFKPFLPNEFSILQIFEDTNIIVSEPKFLQDELTDDIKSANSGLYDYINNGELLLEHKFCFFDLKNAFNFSPKIIFSNLEQNIFKVDVKENLKNIGSYNYCYDYKKLITDLNIYQNSKYKILLFAGTKQSKESLQNYLIQNKLTFLDEFNFTTNKAQIVVSETYFPFSCSFLDSGLIIIGTDDIIKKTKNQVKNLTQKKEKKKVFYLPKVGDYVVHEIHGIGKCIDLAKLNLNGNLKDYFIIEYLGGDKLYLPSEQANSISAFLGAKGDIKLNKIGGQQFAKIKEKVKESVSKLAINLIEIYAQRENSKGNVYNIDNYLLDEFENSFEFDETPDQLSAIQDIKNDMTSTKIMDRLICGDVGYGKTEVALRAIYIAILNGKQVAFLCPTTILSQQHFNTAKDRFSNFMVNVKVLNRFKTKKQQDQIIKETKEGKVDVLIGTHRLLSEDVGFKSLGLLVLDEEQRFGVKDKEKIKQLKNNIDVLTLSATPIPRTLNMAMTGIRDISVIETPPKERIAVKTYVVEESDSLILEACKKEMSRNGQVLFVYNRVEHIYEQARRLQELMPEARIGVAHGQMPEKLLEQTIMDLYDKKFDILVATTLIESGIDLPFANTLIVIDSDKLGLSELYQLRGRIGRSDRTAYAYFSYNPSKGLTADAYKRLDAILEYTSLGSGFKIAMRDLEIRGAGNVLGKEQHGHLEKVGYDMYCKILENAVKELKGEKVKEMLPIKLDIMISANLPDDYVQNQDERINLYSKISIIDSDKKYEEMENFLTENFGKPSLEVINLLKIAFIKNLGEKLGIKRILISTNQTSIYLYKTKEIISKGMNNALSNRTNGVLKFEDLPIINFDLFNTDISLKIDYVLNFLKDSLKV